MTFVNKYISTIILLAELLLSCSTPDENIKSGLTAAADKNKFPIEFVGDKILEYNKPFISPTGGLPLDKDTFSLYSISNNSIDTIWVQTQWELYDSLWPGFKDRTIKIVCVDRETFRKISDGTWLVSSDGNRWGGCDSTQLNPNQKFFFHRGRKSEKPYSDSIKYDIFIKIKKDGIFKDSTVTKKLIFKDSHYIEDISSWNL